MHTAPSISYMRLIPLPYCAKIETFQTVFIPSSFSYLKSYYIRKGKNIEIFFSTNKANTSKIILSFKKYIKFNMNHSKRRKFMGK